MSTLITFALAVGSVGLWTLRVALTARGSRALGSAVAATEAVVFVVAFSHVTGSLDAPLQVAIYGIGVGTGTYVGLTIDRRIKGSHSLSSPSIPLVQDPAPTVSVSPGTSSNRPAGVSSAHATSPGEP